jgi:hypothetical protein
MGGIIDSTHVDCFVFVAIRASNFEALLGLVGALLGEVTPTRILGHRFGKMALRGL